jgi:predicted transcriptional regulator of viral defense system
MIAVAVSARGGAVAIKEYLDTHEAFSIGDFERTFPGSQTDRNLLSRAVKRGVVDRPRRGLYVSRSGQFARRLADPLAVAAAVADDVVFCYLTALRLHGVAHDVTRVTHFYTRHRIAGFGYAGQVFVPHRLAGREVDAESLLTASGDSYRVTTREQTVVDCLTRPALAGGPEHLLRGLGAFTYLDVPKLPKLADAAGPSTVARLGWVAQTKQAAWGMSDQQLTALAGRLGHGPYYFWSSKPPKDSHWVNRWRLYLPHPEPEMVSWLNL